MLELVSYLVWVNGGVVFSAACRKASEGTSEDSEESTVQFWLGSD